MTADPAPGVYRPDQTNPTCRTSRALRAVADLLDEVPTVHPIGFHADPGRSVRLVGSRADIEMLAAHLGVELRHHYRNYATGEAKLDGCPVFLVSGVAA